MSCLPLSSAGWFCIGVIECRVCRSVQVPLSLSVRCRLFMRYLSCVYPEAMDEAVQKNGTCV
jgi:hypothetical protein